MNKSPTLGGLFLLLAGALSGCSPSAKPGTTSVQPAAPAPGASAPRRGPSLTAKNLS